MHPNYKNIAALSTIAIATILSGAKLNRDCADDRGAACYPDTCKTCYCLGPETIIANAPVSPVTCGGDLVFTIAGFYWKAEQDGLEYAIDTSVVGSDGVTANRGLNNLIQSRYETPDFSWDFGLRIGLGYNTPCDGWDIGAIWTYFQNGASSHIEAEFDDNHTLLPIWSAFQPAFAGQAPMLFATDAETFWKLDLQLVDLELGRHMWASKRLDLRPFVGLRGAVIDQDFHIAYKGGSWKTLGSSGRDYNDQIHLENNYWGIGVRSGLDTRWNLGCGLGLFGDLAASLIYGRFSIAHSEKLRLATSPFTKTSILETKDSFRASRALFDLKMGVRWATLLCECKYGVEVSLGWETHLLMHQNQLFDVSRIGGTDETGLVNPSGENLYEQRGGSLSCSGWTLSGKFAF